MTSKVYIPAHQAYSYLPRIRMADVSRLIKLKEDGCLEEIMFNSSEDDTVKQIINYFIDIDNKPVLMNAIVDGNLHLMMLVADLIVDTGDRKWLKELAKNKEPYVKGLALRSLFGNLSRLI